MKLFFQVFIIFFVSVFITSHVTAESTKEIEISNGAVVEVSFEGGTDHYKYEVVFSNGHEYYYEETGNTGYGRGSSDLTMAEMDMADEAIEKYEQLHKAATISPNNSWGNPLGIGIALVGLFITIFPSAAWFLEIGWKLRDSEPSDLALIANRVSGIIMAIVGLVFFL